MYALPPQSRAGSLAGILAVHALLLWAALQWGGVRAVVLEASPLFVAILGPQALTQAPAAQPQPVRPRPDPAAPVPPAATVVPNPVPAPVPAFVAAATDALPAAEAAPAATAAAPAAVASVTPAAPIAPALAPAMPVPVAPPPKLIPASAIQFSVPLLVDYPRQSRRQAESGVVVVRAYIEARGGVPHSVQVEQSCGFLRLDQAALAAVQQARFLPYTENGQPVAGWVRIPIRFDLER